MPKITLDYPPTVNRLYATVRGRRVLSRVGRLYKAKAAQTAWQAGVRPLAGDVSVTIDVWRPRRIGDLDNTLKVVLDCLKTVAWDDDKQIVAITARRHEDKLNPRVELTVEAAVDAATSASAAR